MNNNLVEINNVALGIKEYNCQRVVTFKDIDRVHERPDGTARKAFNRNKKRFIKGEDYFVHEKDEARNLFGIIAPNGVTTITESGYLMISKVFDDDLAWEVQRQLVSSYFRCKEIDNKTENKVADMFDVMTTTLSSINDRLTRLEESQQKKTHPEKKYSRWKTKTFEKLNTLLSYVNANSDETLKLSEIIHLIITDIEDTYNIEMNDYVDAYKSEFGLVNNPYVIDVINHYKDVRDMFSLTLDSIMEKLHLLDQDSKRAENIFNLLIANLENNASGTKSV